MKALEQWGAACINEGSNVMMPQASEAGILGFRCSGVLYWGLGFRVGGLYFWV